MHALILTKDPGEINNLTIHRDVEITVFINTLIEQAGVLHFVYPKLHLKKKKLSFKRDCFSV